MRRREDAMMLNSFTAIIVSFWSKLWWVTFRVSSGYQGITSTGQSGPQSAQFPETWSPLSSTLVEHQGWMFKIIVNKINLLNLYTLPIGYTTISCHIWKFERKNTRLACPRSTKILWLFLLLVVYQIDLSPYCCTYHVSIRVKILPTMLWNKHVSFITDASDVSILGRQVMWDVPEFTFELNDLFSNLFSSNELQYEIPRTPSFEFDYNQLGFGSDKVVFCELLSSMFESNDKENKSIVQCTVHLYSLLINYLMADFKYSQIRQLLAEIENISLLCLNAHCRVKLLCADLRFGLLRLSTIKMLRLDYRGLRNS